MVFQSILFKKPEDAKKEALRQEAPLFFVDLHLDQIIDTITTDKEEYNLKSFFYTSSNSDTIKYRHEIMQDIENTFLFKYLRSFAREMHAMREKLSLTLLVDNTPVNYLHISILIRNKYEINPDLC